MRRLAHDARVAPDEVPPREASSGVYQISPRPELPQKIVHGVCARRRAVRLGDDRCLDRHLSRLLRQHRGDIVPSALEVVSGGQQQMLGLCEPVAPVAGVRGRHQVRLSMQH